MRFSKRLQMVAALLSLKSKKRFLLFTAGILLSSQAFAVPVTYFGENQSPGGTVSGDPVTARNTFLAQVSGAGTEDFESLAVGTMTPINITFPGSTGNITATLAGGGDINGAPGAGRFATSGSNYFETNSNFQITFSTPISAFGFFATDIGDFSGQMSLVLTNGTTVPITIPHTVNGNNGSLLFFGFTDSTDTYTAINFATTSGTDFFGFDDMTVADPGQVGPPPAQIPVFGPLGLFTLITGLLWLGRRRKS